EYQGVKAGHEMNNKILHVLFENPDAWEFVEEKPTKTTISKTAKSKSLAY
ncbi:MAG: UDP-3-O-[3-hydroxymyristoyl] N-acetylglucosamine deacetylase, partial [Rickettsiales bacterium]|nr:UDP-3-O-[3-hydroxymyristoyl] N-acetylglucosamine deacetylase [Rickettsiales bacterium]